MPNQVALPIGPNLSDQAHKSSPKKNLYSDRKNNPVTQVSDFDFDASPPRLS